MGRRVLLTGATSGIGEATVGRLIDDGWDVLATARRKTDLEALAERGATPVRLDLTDDESIREAAAQVDPSEPLDGLVHNAGVGVLGAIEDLGPDAWRHQFAVNLFGPLELTRQLAPALRAAEGRIVFVSSLAALTHVPLYGAYCTSKSALETAGDTLRAEMASAGVDVTMVEPGPVETRFQPRARELLETYVDVEASPHRRSYERLEDAILGAMGEIPVEKVAKAIERGLTARRPPTRIPVGRLAWIGAKLVGWLPARVQDRVLGWFFRV